MVSSIGRRRERRPRRGLGASTSGSGTTAIRQRTGSGPAAIRQRNGSDPAAIRQRGLRDHSGLMAFCEQLVSLRLQLT